MIPKSVARFLEKIMRNKELDRERVRWNQIAI